MDHGTLAAAMPGLDLDRAGQLTAGAEEALRLIGAVDAGHLRRAQHFLSQIGHESVSLRYTEEIADGTAYNGRADLGNTQPGDGPRFKGRSFIQITGRHNYGLFSQWAYGHHLVADPNYFLNHPADLANDRWAWVGSTWYWLTQRPLNMYADADNLEAVTQAINGGLNGLDDRRTRLDSIRGLGSRVLPRPVTAPHPAPAAHPVPPVPTPPGPDRVVLGGHLAPGQSVQAADHSHRLTMQTDGNLVVYHGNTATWATHTDKHPGAHLVAQGDGNIVLYDAAGKPLWSTRTNGRPVNKLVMQGDGNLVAYDNTGHAHWNSATAGK